MTMRKLLVATVLTMLLIVNASPVNAMILKPADGTAREAQCDYIRHHNPGAVDNWPYCGIYTSGLRRLGSTTNIKTGIVYNDSCLSSGTISMTCWGWMSKGFFDTWKINMSVYAKTYYPISPNGSTSFHVYCEFAYSWGITVDMGDCGVLYETTNDYVVGLRYRSSQPGWGGIVPSTSVAWRTYIRCNKWTTVCDSPVSSPV